jgi:hypothetical protein
MRRDLPAAIVALAWTVPASDLAIIARAIGSIRMFLFFFSHGHFLRSSTWLQPVRRSCVHSLGASVSFSKPNPIGTFGDFFSLIEKASASRYF